MRAGPIADREFRFRNLFPTLTVSCWAGRLRVQIGEGTSYMAIVVSVFIGHPRDIATKCIVPL